MEMVETTPVIGLFAIVLLGISGLIGGPSVLLTTFLMYFTISTNASTPPIAEDAVPVDVQRVETVTPQPIVVP